MKTLVRWNKQKLLKGLKADREKNRIGNLRFIDLHVAWLKSKSNREWSKRQKLIIDDVYRKNRHLRPKPV